MITIDYFVHDFHRLSSDFEGAFVKRSIFASNGEILDQRR
jgi:hypothetical protein